MSVNKETKFWSSKGVRQERSMTRTTKNGEIVARLQRLGRVIWTKLVFGLFMLGNKDYENGKFKIEVVHILTFFLLEFKHLQT